MKNMQPNIVNCALLMASIAMSPLTYSIEIGGTISPPKEEIPKKPDHTTPVPMNKEMRATGPNNPGGSTTGPTLAVDPPTPGKPVAKPRPSAVTGSPKPSVRIPVVGAKQPDSGPGPTNPLPDGPDHPPLPLNTAKPDAGLGGPATMTSKVTGNTATGAAAKVKIPAGDEVSRSAQDQILLDELKATGDGEATVIEKKDDGRKPRQMRNLLGEQLARQNPVIKPDFDEETPEPPPEGDNVIRPVYKKGSGDDSIKPKASKKVEAKAWTQGEADMHVCRTVGRPFTDKGFCEKWVEKRRRKRGEGVF